MSLDGDGYTYVLHDMWQRGEVRLPYGVSPIIEGIDQAKWGAASWNPPQGWVELTTPDPNASEKPTWAKMLAADARMNGGLEKTIDRLRIEARQRISQAYRAETFEDEIELRLRNGHTAAQDQERDRLRAVYKQQAILLSGMTNTQRMSYNPSSNAIWRRDEDDEL